MASHILPRLYLVSDRHQTKGRSLSAVFERALVGGGVMIQLREKELGTREFLDFAQRIRMLASRAHSPFLVNDRVDIAIAVNADGVQLRSDSLPVSSVRQLLGREKIIGCSVHSLTEALQVEQEGADFLVLGPIFDTPSKRNFGVPLGVPILEQASGRCRIPIYAIGGITHSRVKEVTQAGAYGVAVISAILGADGIELATQAFRSELI